MADNDFNPYSAPKPLEVTKPDNRPALPREDSGHKRARAGALFWWLYFALCCAPFGANLWSVLSRMMTSPPWDVVFSESGLIIAMQGFALAGLFCYLRKLPLLHSFVWGLVCLGWLGLSIYIPAKTISYLNRHDGFRVGETFFIFLSLYLLRLPELYALWRYSSSSSPIWTQPRIQWKARARKVVDAILYLRRA